jgi:hypothetical protein
MLTSSSNVIVHPGAVSGNQVYTAEDANLLINSSLGGSTGAIGIKGNIIEGNGQSIAKSDAHLN